MSENFVHLHLHTEFSLVDGIVKISPLMSLLSEQGMQAVAITDFSNLFAAVKFYQAAIGKGIKPIIGAEIAISAKNKPDLVSSLILLCQNQTGYLNLTRLISKAYQEGQYQGQPRVLLEWVQDYSDGLIALSGGCRGNIGQALIAGNEIEATNLAKIWMDIFPNRFYLEIMRTGRINEDLYNERLVSIADSLQLPLVATNDVRFLAADDFDAHEARVCINAGHTLADSQRNKTYSVYQYLRTAEEMAELFKDLPHAIQNTVEISKRCTVKLNLGHNYLPNFPTPENLSIESYLTSAAEEGLNQRLFKLFPQDLISTSREPYDARLKIELDVINKMGFAGYFLIVADFIKWAKSNNIPVGPGRGSGAGSLVAYALLITDLDPLQYDLLFERFLNPERVSMPDFDIDFCMDGRDRVIEYVAQKYGRQSVSQIITFGTMAAKAVVRDVGRVLGFPYGFVDKLAKLIPFELGITLKDALAKEEVLRSRYEEEEDVKELFDLALKLEGITKNAGKHAGGVVIAPSELTDFTAIYCEEGSTQIVSQFDKDDVEAVGLVKFDFLGLRTLTIIHRALIIVNKTRSIDPVLIENIPLDDELSFTLLKECKTTAVFQLESRGMKDLIHRLQPDCFEDIIALVALFRPGPLQSGMVDDFIDRKHGRAQVIYPHPLLEPILKPTYGVILYQEQVMQIAQVLANYTLGAADLLRRAMGKKKPEEMAKQRAIFVEGATAQGVETNTATLIFDLMEKFAGYGFNKSHSAAYALVAYQTLWLKAHYKAEFMAAVMSSDLDNTDKIVGFIHECANMGITVLPPSINKSEYAFKVQDSNTLIYGLGAIKGVGESAIETLVFERENGEFKSLFAICARLDLRKVNRRVLEVLIKSGSMDEFGQERASLLATLEKAMLLGAKQLQTKQSGQADLFALFDEEDAIETYVVTKPFTIKERLQFEKETLGLYLTGHPVAPYLDEFKSIIQRISNLNPQKSKKAITCGLVRGVRRVVTKSGKKLNIISLEEPKASLDIVAFAEVFDATFIESGQVLLVEGELSHDDYTGGLKMMATKLYPVAEARTKFARCLSLDLFAKDSILLPQLKDMLRAHEGKCVVQIHYSNSKACAKLNLDLNWRVNPCDELLGKLGDLLGDNKVELCY